jgi:hypothetical protein
LIACAIRVQSPVFRALFARLFVQSRFVDFSAQPKCNFARFDFLRIAQLHFDGNGADDRYPVVVIDDDQLAELKTDAVLRWRFASGWPETAIGVVGHLKTCTRYIRLISRK